MSDEILVAVIGGLVTIVVGIISGIAGYKGAVKGAILQIQKDAQADKEKKKEEELNTKNSIELYLYQEIAENLEILKAANIQALKQRADNTLIGGYHMDGFNFNYMMYDEIKMEIIKLSDKTYIVEIINIYKAFRKINKILRIHEMDREEAKKLYELFQKWIEKLNLMHLK